jgi:diguanylate cyclase (GGDEF)-like protein
MKCLISQIDEAKRLNALYATRLLDSEPEEAFDELVKLVASVCGTPMASISFVDKDRQWAKARLGINDIEVPRDVSFCSHAIQQDDLMVVHDSHKDPRFSTNALVTGDPFIRFYAGQPLVTSSGEKLGALCVLDHVPRKLTGVQREAMRVLARQVMVQIELKYQVKALNRAVQAKDVAESQSRQAFLKLEEANAKLRALSTTDPLTQIKNRRAFDETLESEFERARRLRIPLSLLMLDIDSFKSFNDTYGHVQGDIVLRRIAELMTTTTRETDAVARVGGEEFVAILPATEGAMAFQLADRLRETVALANWEHRQITVSIGVGTLGPGPNSPRHFVDEVDKALYKAKINGKNQVCLTGPPSQHPLICAST